MFLVDYSKEMIKLAKEKGKENNIEAEIKIGDSTKIPYKNNSFDYSICIAVLHCMNKEDSEKTLKELYRVMKPKSKSLISVWNKNSEWFKNKNKEVKMKWRDKGLRNLYLFETGELEKLIKNTGFKIAKSHEGRNIDIIAEKP